MPTLRRPHSNSETRRNAVLNPADMAQENIVLWSDFDKLGNAAARLYSMALNGVVCDPTGDDPDKGGRGPCETCADAWTAIREVLDRYDPNWGNLYRRGAGFQPGRQRDPEDRDPS